MGMVGMAKGLEKFGGQITKKDIKQAVQTIKEQICEARNKQKSTH
jgi:predicted RNA-binding protein associated with RNAse of E/G family